MNYAIIGDVHGSLEPLQTLLKKFGFQKKNGVYQHSEYQAVILGDIVDRGRDQRAVLELVRAMQQEGHAHVVLGNHEYSVAGFHRRHPETGQWLVPHNDYRKTMHGAFNHDFPLHAPHSREAIRWLQSLPVFLELDGFRAVHACWDDDAIRKIKPQLEADNSLGETAFMRAHDQQTSTSQWVRQLIRGATVRLPEACFAAHEKHQRRNVRVRWWQNEYSNWDEILTHEADARRASNAPVPAGLLNKLRYPTQNPHVFFGHYWLKQQPQPVASNLACLDYSCCVGGSLVAYDWREADDPISNSLRADRFVSVPGVDFRLHL